MDMSLLPFQSGSAFNPAHIADWDNKVMNGGYFHAIVTSNITSGRVGDEYYINDIANSPS